MEPVCSTASGEPVGAGAAIEAVVAFATNEGVFAVAAIEAVVAAVAADQVVEAVAGAIYVCFAGEAEVLHIGDGGQGETDAGLYSIGAFSGGLCDQIGAGIHDVGVVTGTAAEGVDPGAAIEGVVAVSASEAVVAAVADEQVVEAVAGAVYVCAAGEGEVLHIGDGGQGEADPGLHGIGACVGGLCDQISAGIHDVDVVTSTTAEAVDAVAAIEGVVAVAAGEAVVAAVAGDRKTVHRLGLCRGMYARLSCALLRNPSA